jgi:glycosyltransferase involved in cell wall biosynthesis
MIMDNRRRKTWDIDIDQWIALSEHSRAQFIDSGVPGEKILVKPNFCPDPGFVSAPPDGRHVILYIGRLSPEKGILVLLKAWKKLEDESATFNGELRIVGDGPSREIVERACTALRSARFIGWQCPKDVLKTIQQSHAVVVPSLVPETFGRSVIEAWSCARPVLAASIGALSELVHDDVDGRLHTPADVPMLARQIRELMEDAATGLRLGRAGHERWKKTYSPDINYALLMRAYEQARENFARTFH